MGCLRESNLKNDGVKVVKKGSTTYNDNFIHVQHLQLIPKRRLDGSSRGRELVSEWNGTATNGVFNLVRKVTKTSGTIKVDGTLDITGIVGDDGIRPAIDGGKTPGCTHSCPGHTVFHVDNTNDELRLTNITIQNGYVVRFHILFYVKCILFLYFFNQTQQWTNI